MTSLVCHPGSAILDFTIVLKGQDTEINVKSRRNAYAVYKFVNFCNLMKKENWKKYRIVSKESIFGHTT